MARTVTTSSTLENWRQNYNDLATDVGDPTTLTTGSKDSVVNAINYIQDQYFFFQDFDFDGSDGATSNGQVRRNFSGTDNNGNTLQYKAQKVLVYKNGLLLRNGTDYIATDGTNVLLASSAGASDVIRITSYTGSYTQTPAGQESIFHWQTAGSNVFNNNSAGLVLQTGRAAGAIVTAPLIPNSIQLDGPTYANYPVTVGVDDTGHDVKFFGATAGSYLLWDESADSLLLTDSTPIKLGDSQDLQIYHDGSNSYVKDSGTGALRILGSQVIVRNPADSETMLHASEDGAVILYYDNANKLATVTGGIEVTGDTDTDTLTVSGNATVSGATALNGGLTMDTNKFTVADTSGNTAIAGTLAVTGVATLTARSVHTNGITIGNGTKIGSVGNGNAIDIATSGVVSFDQVPVLPANTIDSDHYVDGSIDSAHIANNAVDATRLNVSGNGTNGYALISDGDGSFSWAAFSGSDTTYSTSWVDDSDDVILRLTPSAGGADDLTLVAGTGITLTPSGDDMTIAASGSNATTLTVADESSDTTCFPLFVTAATGDLAPKSGTNLTFNSSSGVLAGATWQGTPIANAYIADGSITSAKIAANTIATADIATNAVTSSELADGSVATSDTIANDVIDSQHYVDGSIDLAHMSANSIDSNQYVDGSIDTAHIAASNITNALMADDAIGIAELSATGTASSSTFLRGDNAWTAVPSAAITSYTNSANNRVLTSVDSTTVNGESGLTYDGSTLAVTGALTVSGNMTVSGTTTTINSTTLSVDDKNIELGSVASPSDSTADGGGITLKGASDKTILWVNSTDTWDFNQKVKSTNGFEGALTGNASTATALATSRDFSLTGNVTASVVGFTGAANVTLNTTIANDAVTEAMIADDSISGSELKDNAVDSDHYTDGSIDTIHLSADCVTAAKIADDAVDSEHIAADSIDTEHYAAASVDTTALGADCVTAAKIGNNVLDSEHYAAGSIDNEHLADDAVGVAELSATGTANSGTFLRGDNSWAAVSDSTVDPDAANSSAATRYPLMHINNTGSSATPVTASGLSFVASTNTLSTTNLDIAGNVDVDGVLETDNLTINGAQGSDGQVLTSTGDGVAWEAASSGTISSVSNFSDNRVVTASGGTTLNGESGLTFDGNDLNVSRYVYSQGFGLDSTEFMGFSNGARIMFTVASEEKARITSADALEVRGDIIAFSGTYSSDIALKENINPISNALDKIIQLGGYTFDWKDKKHGSSTGLIAQEVEKILPDLVKDQKGLHNHKTLNYNGIIGLLVESIKELKNEVESLKDSKS